MFTFQSCGGFVFLEDAVKVKLVLQIIVIFVLM